MKFSVLKLKQFNEHVLNIDIYDLFVYLCCWVLYVIIPLRNN
jgi:hypothetical protein